jgi:hypothetical protein
MKIVPSKRVLRPNFTETEPNISKKQLSQIVLEKL